MNLHHHLPNFRAAGTFDPFDPSWLSSSRINGSDWDKIMAFLKNLKKFSLRKMDSNSHFGLCIVRPKFRASKSLAVFCSNAHWRRNVYNNLVSYSCGWKNPSYILWRWGLCPANPGERLSGLLHQRHGSSVSIELIIGTQMANCLCYFEYKPVRCLYKLAVHRNIRPNWKWIPG
jgi:hypothetical protein